MHNENLVLVDNDVLIKVSEYLITDSFLRLLLNRNSSVGILSSARFVVNDRLNRNSNNDEQISRAWDELFAGVNEIVPDTSEILLAAEFEEIASRANVEFDVGESLLLSVLIHRNCRAVITGDKRAIISIGKINKDIELGSNCVGCFEQLMISMLSIEPFFDLRSRICANANTDKTMTICFSCSSSSTTKSVTTDAIRSYISEVRTTCPDGLLDGDDLSRIIS